MATPLDRSTSFLQDLAELPPARRGPAQPMSGRPDLFDRAMRQDDRAPQTLMQRLLDGQFHKRLVGGLVLVSAILLIIVVL